MTFPAERYDLVALNDAIAEGRCWDLAGTTEDGRRWIVGDESDAARVTPPWGSSHRLVPRGRILVLERVSGELRALEPVDDVEINGRRWRAGRDSWDNTERLHVEHPTLGWTFVNNTTRLGRIASVLSTLPPDDGAPRRYTLPPPSPRRMRYAATTNWDFAWALTGPDERLGPEMEVTEGVTPAHVTEIFALWSDGEVTASEGLRRPWPSTLEAAAEELIHLVLRSGTVRPRFGWNLLARVAEIRVREVIARGPADRYDVLERLRVVLVDGEETDLWLRSTGHEAFPECKVHAARPEAWGVDADGMLLPLKRNRSRGR